MSPFVLELLASQIPGRPSATALLGRLDPALPSPSRSDAANGSPAAAASTLVSQVSAMAANRISGATLAQLIQLREAAPATLQMADGEEAQFADQTTQAILQDISRAAIATGHDVPSAALAAPLDIPPSNANAVIAAQMAVAPPVLRPEPDRVKRAPAAGADEALGQNGQHQGQNQEAHSSEAGPDGESGENPEAPPDLLDLIGQCLRLAK